MKKRKPSTVAETKAAPRATRSKSKIEEPAVTVSPEPTEESPAPTEKPAAAPRARKSLIAGIAGAAKELLRPKNIKIEPKTEVTAETKVRRTYTRKKKIEMPAILLEGDHPAPVAASGPGEKYALGPTPPQQSFPTAESELPESY